MMMGTGWRTAEHLSFNNTIKMKQLKLPGLILKSELKEKSITTYLQEKFWTPLGMASNASWSLDKRDGVEKTICCVNAIARNFAKIGRLSLNIGNWNGEQIVNKNWIAKSTSLEEGA